MVLALGVGGHVLRAAGGDPTAPPAVLLDPAGDGDPLAHRDRGLALARPLAPGERIAVNRADAAELGRLPGVGPALAARIVADREARGAFSDITALDRVPGIGGATLARLAPHLSFAGAPADPWGSPSAALVSLNRAVAADLERLPGIGAARARAIVAFRDSAGPFREVADLVRVPGLPAAVVARISPLVRVP